LSIERHQVLKRLATSGGDTAQGFDLEKSSLREDVSRMFAWRYVCLGWTRGLL